MNRFFPLLFFFSLASLLFPVPVLRRSFYITGAVWLAVNWGRRETLRKLRIDLDLNRGCGFPGDDLFLVLHLANRSFFPLPWLAVYQSFPEQLGAGREQFLVSLGPRAKKKKTIVFRGYRRGIYPLPALRVAFGDVWGIDEASFLQRWTERVVIYPRVVPVYGLSLQRHLPFGPHRMSFGLHEDPSRLRGCREYRAGDGLRRIHWPNMARTGRIQVKEWETTLDAEIGIFLNLREEDFPVRDWSSLVELEVELAASLIHRMVEKGEHVAFYANGKAYGEEEGRVFHLPAKKGKGQRKKIFTYLAGVTTAPGSPPYENFFQEAKKAVAGACLLFITPQVTPEMVKRAGDLRKAGYHPSFLQPSHKTAVLPVKELKEKKIPCFIVKRRREDDALLLVRQV